MGHAARLVSSGDCASARAGFQSVHRRRSARDDSASLVEDDGRNGLFVRRADPHDGRRVFVELAPGTSQALRRYFAEMGNQAVI